MSKDTAVRLLTIIFTPIAGGLVAWLAKHGLSLNAGAVVTLGVSAALAVLTTGLHYLQKNATVDKIELDVDHFAEKVVGKIKADPDLHLPADTILGELRAQSQNIVEEIGKAVHAPPSVEEIVSELLAQVAGAKGPKPPADAPAPLQVVPDPPVTSA